MAEIRVEVTREIAAPPDRVFACIADFARRPEWLPDGYSDFGVEQDKGSPSTVIRYKLKVGPRERSYQMRTSQPTPGSILVEDDTNSSLVKTWTVTARGNSSQVSVATRWDSNSKGIGGIMERTFAPRGLRKLYDEELTSLARFVVRT